jgi:hypothetical protein
MKKLRSIVETFLVAISCEQIIFLVLISWMERQYDVLCIAFNCLSSTHVKHNVVGLGTYVNNLRKNGRG